MREGTTSRVMATDRTYGEFYDFYGVSPEYFGYTLIVKLFRADCRSGEETGKSTRFDSVNESAMLGSTAVMSSLDNNCINLIVTCFIADIYLKQLKQ
jgi:hypothetical protein